LRVVRYENHVRRFVLFLGLFSLFALALLAASGELVERGVMHVKGHTVLAWSTLFPMAAYTILSLRELLKRPGA
jgi:hypothetical protein